MPETSSTFTITRWDSLGTIDAPAPVVAVLATAVLVLGYFLGRWAGLRGPGDWFWVWLAVAALGRLAMGQQVALSGWLLFAGALGSMACAAGFVRSTLPKRGGLAPP